MTFRSVCLAPSLGQGHLLGRDIPYRRIYISNVTRNAVSHRKRSLHLLLSSGASYRDENTPSVESAESPTSESQRTPSLQDRIKNFFGSGSFDRQRLAKLGMALKFFAGVTLHLIFLCEAKWRTLCTRAWSSRLLRLCF